MSSQEPRKATKLLSHRFIIVSVSRATLAESSPLRASDRGFRPLEPVFHAMPFVIGIAQAVGLLAAGTPHGLFVGEFVGSYGLAVNDFRQGCRHSFVLTRLAALGYFLAEG